MDESEAHDQVLLHGITMLLTSSYSLSANLLAYLRLQRGDMADERAVAETLQLIEGSLSDLCETLTSFSKVFPKPSSVEPPGGYL